jgi:hypothetical protein
MTVTYEAEYLILVSVIRASIDNIDVIAIEDVNGEVFRKVYQRKDSLSDTERRYTFYLTEEEGNANITKLVLYGSGATTEPGSGFPLCEQPVDIEKTNTQSLLIYWTVKVVA